MANGKTVRFSYVADASSHTRAATQIVDANKRIEAEIKQVAKAMEKARKEEEARAAKLIDLTNQQYDALGSAASKASLFVSLPLAAAGVAFSQMAADAEESANKVRVVFGESASAIEQWSKSAVQNLAMTSKEAQDAAATFGIFAQGAGLAADDTVNFSKAMVQLATDMTSLMGGAGATTAEAIEAIGAALRGEFEPIRRYGVILDVATVQQEAMRLGLIKQGEELNRTARLLATQSLILKQAEVAQGDFARTSGSAANQQRVQVAAAKEQAIAFGRQLLPVMQVVIGAVARLLKFINDLSDGQRRTALSIAAFAFAIGPAVKGALALIGVIRRITEVAKTATTVQAFFTAAVGGPAAIAALGLGAAAALGFVYALNKAVDAGAAAGNAAEENADLAAEAGNVYAGVSDVLGMYEDATVESTGATKKAKAQLSEATKEAAQFGEAIKSAFESASSASSAYESIVVPDLESTTNAWEDAVKAVEDAQRRLARAMDPASADDLRSAELDVFDARIALEKATEKATAAQNDAEQSDRDRIEAQIDLERAGIRLREQEAKYQDLQRKGTALDADVVEAKGAVREATDKLNAATVELQHAQAGITPELLLDALREQQEGAQQWADSLVALSHQGIDQGILKELARLGPEGLPKAQAFFDFVSAYGSASLNGLVGETRSALDRALNVFPEVRPAMEAVARQSGEGVGEAFGGGVARKSEAEVKTAVENIFDSFRNIKALVGNVPSLLAGGPPGWNLPSTGAVQNALIPLGRQMGGPVRAGAPYVVGERGWEWFVPDQSGTILPHGTGVGGTTVNVYVSGPLIAQQDLGEYLKRTLLDFERRGG
jgi:hypothetical protein